MPVVSAAGGTIQYDYKSLASGVVNGTYDLGDVLGAASMGLMVSIVTEYGSTLAGTVAVGGVSLSKVGERVIYQRRAGLYHAPDITARVDDSVVVAGMPSGSWLAATVIEAADPVVFAGVGYDSGWIGYEDLSFGPMDDGVVGDQYQIGLVVAFGDTPIVAGWYQPSGGDDGVVLGSGSSTRAGELFLIAQGPGTDPLTFGFQSGGPGWVRLAIGAMFSLTTPTPQTPATMRNANLSAHVARSFDPAPVARAASVYAQVARADAAVPVGQVGAVSAQVLRKVTVASRKRNQTIVVM